MEIVEGVDPVLDGVLNDKVNDAYGLIYALANFLSPLIGTFLYNLTDQRTTCDYVALFNVAYGAVLFVFNCGPKVFAEN